MVDNFNGLEQCRNIAQANESGCFQVNSNGVTWNIFVKEGYLQYAAHSLQTIDTLKHYLNKLGYQVPGETLEHLQSSLWSTVQSINQGLLLYEASEQLHQKKILDIKATKAIKLELSKDALEPLFWLRKARYMWFAQESYHTELIAFPLLINQLEERLRTWQKLEMTVTSPHQRPYCSDLNKLTQPVPNGMLNQALLKALIPLMQGNSIHQLALSLKQDSLKVAHLLNPYIQQQCFLLRPPVPPYDKLPSIPALADTQIPSQSTTLKSVSSRTSKQVHKIVCIDDSPAMLETVQDYLGAEGFEVATVENPMESMSTLFSMKPDLILMDVSMPGINGNRLCEILRRSAVFKKLPIIMVSSNTSVLDRAKAESSGATDYLTKPFSKEELLTIVEEHLKVALAA